MSRKHWTKPIGTTLDESHTKDAETGCWVWHGSKTKLGYGVINRYPADGPRKTILAHRASYEHFVGPIPEGMKVCHRCDVPLCINPAHLWAGTQADNVADMISKGRDKFGMGHRPLTFPEERLREIANDNRPPKIIAAEIGVTWQTIYRWRARFGSKVA